MYSIVNIRINEILLTINFQISNETKYDNNANKKGRDGGMQALGKGGDLPRRIFRFCLKAKLVCQRNVIYNGWNY